MITQSFSSPMLAEGIGAFTSQFKKGGMTNKNTKKKLSKKEIEFIEAYANNGEVSNSDLFADGGKTIDAVWDDYRIADQYEGKKAEDIWFRLSPSQRRHLLTDHANIPNGGDLSAYDGDDVKFDDLEPFMKKILRKHFAEGQYAKGGKTKTKFSKGDKVIGQFRNEYGEGLQPVSLMDYADRVRGVVSNVKKIDTTTMYVIDFENGEQLQYPDFAIDNFIAKSSFAKGGGVRKKENVYHESKNLTKEQWEKWNDYVKTGKINGKKVNNIYTVANHIGVGVSQINAYEMEQKRKDMNNQYAKGGSTDPKPSAQDILKRLGYNLPAPAEQEEEEPKIIRGYFDDEPYYFAKGGMSKDDSPKVYIADLMEYNNGRLVGKWFDLTDYSDASELMQDIQAMLDEQTKKDPDGEVHEEFAVHDYENFPRAMYSEYMNEADFQKIIDVIQGAEDSNLPFDVILKAMSDLELEDIIDVKDRYFSSVPASMGNEWRDFAYEYIDGIGGISSAIKNPDYYFDFEAFGRDERINMGGEQEEEMGYEDLTDEQLGEQLVDEIGGVGELSESTIDMYFDYDKFGRELQYDFTAVRGEDGNYYFFTTNYKKGGKLKSKPDPKDEGEYELTEEDKKIIRGYVDDEPYYFAKGGSVSEKSILSFSFNTDNVKLNDVKKVVEQFSKDWRTSGDISEVNMFVIIASSKVSDLKYELREEFGNNVYDFEIQQSRYAKGGGVKKGLTVKSKMPIKYNFKLETAGEFDSDLKDEKRKIDILRKYIEFDQVVGNIDYEKLDGNTILDFLLDGKVILKLRGNFNERTSQLETIIETDDDSASLNYHPFDSMGGLDFSEIERQIQKAINKITEYSAIVSIEGYEEYGETLNGLEQAKSRIQDIKGSTKFQVLKGERLGIGKLVTPDSVVYEANNQYAKGGMTTDSALEILMNEEPKVWDKFGFDSGGEIRASKEKTKKYAQELEKVLSQKGISRNSLPEKVYDELQDENYHLLNEFLGRNGYFKKAINDSLTERYESPSFSKYYADKESITVSPSKSAPKKVSLKGLSGKTKYIPNRDIKSVELKSGKELSNADIIDGVYQLKSKKKYARGGGVKKGVKVAKKYTKLAYRKGK